MDAKICFVIMPFSQTENHPEEYWTEHFETFLKPLIEICKLEARRSIALREDILRQIITSLVVSPVVVADLTDHNANVYWELGVRQSFKDGTVTIAEEGTELPFDVSVKGTLFYKKDKSKDLDFCKRFKEAICDCLKNSDKRDSHVLETLSGRGTLFEIFRRDDTSRRLEAVISEGEWNINLLSMLAKPDRYPQIDESIKRGDIPSRFRSTAIELLVSERYVDEDELFYNTAEVALGWIIAANSKLSNLMHVKTEIDQWFSEKDSLIRNIFNELDKKVEAHQEKLRKQF